MNILYIGPVPYKSVEVSFTDWAMNAVRAYLSFLPIDHPISPIQIALNETDAHSRSQVLLKYVNDLDNAIREAGVHKAWPVVERSLAERLDQCSTPAEEHAVNYVWNELCKRRLGESMRFRPLTSLHELVPPI